MINIIQIFKFGLVGLSGTGVDFGTTYLFKEKFSFNKYWASSIGFLLAVTSNYVFNRIWTFHNTNTEILSQFIKFASIGFIGLGLSNVFIYIFHNKMHLGFYISKLMAIGVVMVWNYGANVLYTFH